MANRIAPVLLGLGLFALGACAAVPRAAAPTASHSILAGSSPAAGANVPGPLNELRLRFRPPARLGEVMVTGSDGQAMPMMVHAVGEVADYSIPLPGLEAGHYRVDWKASVGATPYAGSFTFSVR